MHRPDQLQTLPPRDESDSVARDLEGLRLVVDPGHGGFDAGDDPGEAEWALSVATELTRLCRDLGADVVPTRSENTFVPRILRNAYAREWEAAIILSLHRGSPHAHSAAAVRFGSPWWRRRQARALARHLLEALDRTLPVRTLPWVGIRQGRCRCPSGPILALPLLLIAHPPAHEDREGATAPLRWAEALAHGLAAYHRASRRGAGRPESPPPMTRALEEDPGVPTVAAASPAEHPSPRQAPGSPQVQSQTLPLTLGRRQIFTLPTRPDGSPPSKK